MAKLDAKKRASLPNSAFAYVDSKGRRRLPIHDEAHVRNALARFNQVRYEDDEARERAFRRLLKAATKYGIAPVGFVTRQLREARSDDAATLPSGDVTFLLTDIEGSTGLLHCLGEGYASLLSDVRALIRASVGSCAGYEVDARADEFFAAFARAEDALMAALDIQRSMRDRPWPERLDVRVRIGLHSGSPALTDTGYVGLPVHTAARICRAGHGGQILISTATRDALSNPLPPGVRLRTLGVYDLRGLPEPEELLQVETADLTSAFPGLRVLDQD